MRALVNAATNSLIALRTLVSAGIHRYAERPQLPRTGSDAVDPTRTLTSPHDQSGAVNSAAEDGG
jgi:hypothetical protein